MLSLKPSLSKPSTSYGVIRAPAKHSRSFSTRGQRLIARAAPQLDFLKDIQVASLDDGMLQDVTGLWERNPGQKCILAFMTHWGDLGSWEYAQRLSKALAKLEEAGVEVRCIGLGSVQGGRKFSEFTGFPQKYLYADQDGACCEALGFEAGFAPDAEISPYAKLVPMLLGVESEGTIPEVLRGYFGDQSKKEVFEGATPFNLIGGGYQRPFELATLRLMNSVKIIQNWNELCPPKTELITRQGGTYLFEGDEVIFNHRDTGILITPDVDDLVAAALGN
ncbi:hypothetical protein BSKO_01732 [Bryopsis sp. KO-2023]|nr:hypothetical protein BSKO_01732 [Bryopsis sp. KO-2023]